MNKALEEFKTNHFRLMEEKARLEVNWRLLKEFIGGRLDFFEAQCLHPSQRQKGERKAYGRVLTEMENYERIK